MRCRLCNSNKLAEIRGADNLKYYLCSKCMIINAELKNLIDSEKEKERYLAHDNGIEYEGYLNFLYKAINPALKYLNKNMIGLDYGCGYAPTLSKLLQIEGIECDDYDPFFFKINLKEKYDFIFSTEVFEHFLNPKNEIAKLVGLLKNNGFLIVMTERWQNESQFRDWYYTKDPTHISFYHNYTFDFICEEYGFRKIYDDLFRIIILQRVN